MPEGPDPIQSRTLRERLGGRWAIAWQSYLITGFLGIIALFAGEEHFATSASVALSWLGLCLLASLCIGINLVILDATLFRNRRVVPLPVWLVVVVDGLLGVTFALVVGLGASALGLETNISIVERVVLDAIYAMWWGPTLTYFLDYREQAINVRKDLIAEAVQIEVAGMQRAELVERFREELSEAVDAELGPARTAVEAHLLLSEAPPSADDRAAVADWSELSGLLRGTAESSVRPLSRRLWNETAERYPKTPWWQLPANILRYQPFRPVMYAAVDILGTGTVQVRLFGLSRGLFLSAMMVAIIFVVMMSANVAMRAFPRWHTAIFVMGIVALQVTLVVRVHLREQWAPGSASVGWQAIQVVVGILVVFVTSGFGSWSEKNAELRSNFRADIRKDRVESIARSRQVADLARETAQVLHGSVQTRLVSCAMAIDAASASGDQAALNEALREALIVLAEPMSPQAFAGSVSEEVARKVALWEGLCVFTIRVDEPGLESLPIDSATVGRIVEEAISNAVRHGQAEHIDVMVDVIADGSVRVVVEDDGRGPCDGKAGIGSAFLEQASRGRWSLTALARGTRLEVIVPA